MKVVSWNIRRLCGVHYEDPLQIHDPRKTVMINLKLKRLKIDIDALQDSRLLSSGSLRKSDTLFSDKVRILTKIGFMV